MGGTVFAGLKHEQPPAPPVLLEVSPSGANRLPEVVARTVTAAPVIASMSSDGGATGRGNRVDDGLSGR